ncbi:MAG: shikimate dehydrogenase, partial [Cyanobacteriota bacterium]|nr:shikimate dehydrogenase [Cyanobacteriota bacterium]
SLGFAAVAVAGRDPGRLAALAQACRGWLPQLEPIPWHGNGPDASLALLDALAGADLLVNTTPVGLASSRDPQAASRCPLTGADLRRLRPGSTVYDLIYTPRPTRLLQAAREQGCRTVDGLEMLVRQGAASLRLWSGVETVPVEVMRHAALAQLEGS